MPSKWQKHPSIKHTTQIPTGACRLHNFASSRRNLRNDSMSAPSPPSKRIGRAPGFEAKIGKPTDARYWGPSRYTCHLRCRRMFGLCQALMLHVLHYPTGSLLGFAIAFLLDLTNAVFVTILPSMCSCSDHAWCGSPMTPPGLLKSLGGKPPHVLHHHMMHRHQTFCLPVITAWSIAPKLARAHPTPHVVGQHIGHRIRHLHITSQKIHQIHSMLSITHHPRVTTIGPHIAQFLV